MPYRTRCRFFRDSDVESEIRWVVARPDAKTLPFESAIVNSFNEYDKELGFPVGEVWGASRPYTGQVAPAGLEGQHVCGDPADFAQGGEYLPDLPPVRYGALGYPLCCNPPKRVGGGAAAGGYAPLIVTSPIEPGATCDDAPTLAFGETHEITVTHVVSNWVRIPLPAGVLCYIATTIPIPVFQVEINTGTNCVDLLAWSPQVSPGGCYTIIDARTDCFVYLDIVTPSVGHVVSVRLDLGMCP